MLTVSHALKLSRKKFLRNVRSDGRLKKYDSTTDERAWTLDKYERQHYIRDYIAAPYGPSQTGQTQGCEDKLPLHMLLGALLSAKNQLLDNLQDQVDQLNNALSECKEDLNVCTGETQRSKPSENDGRSDSKLLFRQSTSREETVRIETEDEIFEDTRLEYRAETSEIPADGSEDEKNDIGMSASLKAAGMVADGNRIEGSAYDEDDCDPGEANIEDCLETSGMPMDLSECSDSDDDDDFECEDPVPGSDELKGLRGCEQDELKVYINICDNDANGQPKEIYIGSLRLPKSSTAGTMETETPRSMSGYHMRYNGSSHGRKPLEDPCQRHAKYSRNRRSQSAGSRPSSPCDYQRQHAMIQKLNYYGNCQEYPSTANTPQSSSLDEFLSQYEQDCPPSTLDDNFRGSLNYRTSKNAQQFMNNYPPSDTINSQKSFPTRERNRPCNPSTKQRRSVSRKKKVSKSMYDQPYNQHSYNPCTERARPKTSSGISPFDSHPTTPPYTEYTTQKTRLEDIGVENYDNYNMYDTETPVTNKPSQATQTNLTCSDIRESGMINRKDIEAIQNFDETPQNQSKNRISSEGSRSHSLESEITTPGLLSRRSRVYEDELQPQRKHHRRHNSLIPCRRNESNNNRSSVLRTEYPNMHTSDSRSNSLIDLQSRMNRNSRLSKPRSQNNERHYYPSTNEYDPSQMCDEDNSMLGNRVQRMSREGDQQMYNSRYSVHNSNTQMNTQIQPQSEMSAPYSIRCQNGFPQYNRHYSAQNSCYPQHSFQQTFTYTYPYC